MLAAKPRKTVDSVEKIIVILERKNLGIKLCWARKREGFLVGFFLLFFLNQQSQYQGSPRQGY
jgi:hypothetical protein